MLVVGLYGSSVNSCGWCKQMLLVPQLNGFIASVDNWDASPGTTNNGVNVTPGTSNSKGSWTQVLSSGSVPNDVYAVEIRVTNGFIAATSKQNLLDLGIDPTGGSSYTPIINNLIVGAQGGLSNIGVSQRVYTFPLRIPSGASVAVRIQSSDSVATAQRVTVNAWSKPVAPGSVVVGGVCQTIGTVTNSTGVSFTPGNSGSWGTPVSLGTVSTGAWWTQIGYQIDNAALSTLAYYIDLMVGSSGNQRTIQRDWIATNTNEYIQLFRQSNATMFNCLNAVAPGDELWVRGMCSGVSNTGWNALAYVM